MHLSFLWCVHSMYADSSVPISPYNYFPLQFHRFCGINGTLSASFKKKPRPYPKKYTIDHNS